MKRLTITTLIMLFNVIAHANTYGEGSYVPPVSYSFGGSYTHEIATNFTGASFVSGKECKNCDSGTNLSFSASYLHYWKENMQWGVEGGVRMLSKEISGTGESETLMDVVGLGVYNFDRNLRSAPYVKGGIGFVSVRNDNNRDYETKLGLFVGIGKRFSWLTNISYSPELRLVKRGDIDVAIHLEILNFAIYW